MSEPKVIQATETQLLDLLRLARAEERKALRRNVVACYSGAEVLEILKIGSVDTLHRHMKQGRCVVRKHPTRDGYYTAKSVHQEYERINGEKYPMQ